jgi:glyoxylate reductase
MNAQPVVVVARVLPDAGVELLEGRSELRIGGLDADRDRLIELVRGADALIADPTVPVDAELLDAAGPQLRVVANFAVGYDNVDLGACRERSVAVTNTPDVLTNATAELALALTLAAARALPAAERDLRGGGWRGWDPRGYLGTELSGATFGIVGLGRIGSRYAELVRPLAGEILYTSRTSRTGAEAELGARRAAIDELFETADVVSLHLPATEETRWMVNRERLEAMRPTAILVNTSRGALVEPGALAAALEEGSIAAAGLDVYVHEPEVEPELLAAPNAILLPHIGSATERARSGMARLAADNALAAVAGRPLLTPVE